MIVTSKRCFLNKFIQRNRPEVVLNANYYIGDKQPSGGGTMITPEIRRNEFGQLENLGQNYTDTTVPMGSIYHIKYNKVLNPQSYVAEQLMAINGNITAEDRLINHFQKQSTILRTYKFLFADKLEGNGLQILIFEDHKNMWRFGHLICQFLSTMFGADIVFIDAACTPKCNGYPEYKGSQQGLSNIVKIRQYDMIFNFEQAITQSQHAGSLSNINTHLAQYDINDLMYLYNLMYPNAPLPPGNYSEDQLREILIYRATAGTFADTETTSNLLIQHDWEAIIERMSSEAEDFASDDTGLF